MKTTFLGSLIWCVLVAGAVPATNPATKNSLSKEEQQMMEVIRRQIVRPIPLKEYPFREEYPFKNGVNTYGRAVLGVSKTRLHVGEWFTVDIRFDKEGMSCFVYNPFMYSKVPVPAAVAIYDSERRYIGLYYSREGSRTVATLTETRVCLFSGCYVGASKKYVAGYVPNTEWRSSDHTLPLGKYYLQAIYFQGFVTFQPWDKRFDPKDEKQEPLHFDMNELCRSNVVEIELLPAQENQNPAKPTPATQPATRPARMDGRGQRIVRHDPARHLHDYGPNYCSQTRCGRRADL